MKEYEYIDREIKKIKELNHANVIKYLDEFNVNIQGIKICYLVTPYYEVRIYLNNFLTCYLN